MTTSLARSLPSMALLAAGIVLGGGGSPSPGWELALQLVFAAIVGLTAVSALVRPSQGPADPVQPAALGIAALVLLIPLVQLIPFPPGLWQALPGRGDELAALQLADAGERWMPWSKTPSRTLAALLAMIVPAVLLVMVARLDTAGRTRVLAVAVAAALASVLLGALQLADGEGGRWRLQAQTHLTYLTGFQANRNHQADVLSLALLAAAACWASLPRGGSGPRAARQAPGAGRIALLLAVPMLAFGTLMTGSRAGLLLALLAWGVAALIVWPARSWAARAKGLALGAVLAAVGAAALLQLPSVQRVALRFSEDGANRAALWQDTRKAIALHWPAGSGIGSFQPVFIASEALDNVDATNPVRAHNDWLELTLEAGLAGWAVLAALAGLIGWELRARVQRLRDVAGAAPAECAQVLFGAAVLAILALHSLADYPLRSMSLACLAAVAAAMILNPSAPHDLRWADDPARG